MTAKPWLKHARLATWRLEFSDLAWPDAALSAKWERRAEHFREKGVNTVVLSGFHFRWDYVGLFERVFGILGEIAELCHRHDLRVIERHSATRVHRPRDEADRRSIRRQFNQRVPFYPDDWTDACYRGDALAEWRQISARDGEPVFLSGDASCCFCPNHPRFQQAYADYIRRFLGTVRVDAILTDGLRFLPDVFSCVCPHCREKWRAETGRDLPDAADRSFWRDRGNPDFHAWIEARYRWQAEHCKRLRGILPKEILLLATFSSCLQPGLAETGSSAFHLAEHLDAICYEIPSSLHLGGDEPEIAAELAAFSSLARIRAKPLVTRFRADHADQVPGWVHFLGLHHAQPWVAKQVRRENAVPEEELLANGFGPPDAKKDPGTASVQAICFSEAFRDSLSPAGARNYVEIYRALSADLLARGSVPHVVLDSMWSQTPPGSWECLWILDWRALDEKKLRVVRKWQESGLPIGTA